MNGFIGSFPVARTLDITRQRFAGRTSTFSSSIFGAGRANLLLPPAEVPQYPAPIVVEKNPDLKSQVAINLLSNQLIAMTKQMQDIGGALEKIAYYIALDTGIEQNRENQKQAQERIAVEQGARSERESLIERRIQSTLTRPVEIIAQKAQGVLSRLMGFFGSLLLGWLTNQGIEAIKENAKGAKNKLEEIKDNVFQTLGVAFKTFYLIREGFLSFAKTVGNIALKLGKFLLMDVIGGIFRGLFNLGKSAVNAGKNLLGIGTKSAAAATSAAASTATAITKGAQKATKSVAQKALGVLGRLTPGLGTALNLGAAAYRFKAGDIPGAAMSVLSSVPLLGIPVVAADIYRDINPSAFKGTILENPKAIKEQEKAQAKSSPTATKTLSTASSSPSKVQPQTPTTSSVAAPVFSVDNAEMTKSVFNENQIEKQETPSAQMNPVPTNEVNVFPQNNITYQSQTVTPMTSLTPSEENISFNMNKIENMMQYNQIQSAETPSNELKAKIAPIPVSQMEKMQKISQPLAEPSPNVVVMKTSSQQAQLNTPSTVNTPANDVPAISSSNSENFYTLYSQVHYNVVT